MCDILLGTLGQLLRCHLNDRSGDASLHEKNRCFSGIGQIPPVCGYNPRYEAQGFSHKDALAQTSQDLGHGDGRGRYIEQVYSRR